MLDHAIPRGFRLSGIIQYIWRINKASAFHLCSWHCQCIPGPVENPLQACERIVELENGKYIFLEWNGDIKVQQTQTENVGFS